MGKKFKKVISLFLVAFLFLASAPLQGFKDIDWSWIDMFSLNASAASTSTTTSDWTIKGDAYYDSNNKYYVLTPDSYWSSGSIWLNNQIESDFVLTLDYYTGNRTSGADGMAVVFYNDDNSTSGEGEEMMYTGLTGYAVELDTYYNSEPTTSNHISINKSQTNHLAWNYLSESEDGKWHNLKIIVSNQICYVYVDGKFKTSHETKLTGDGYFGITAATGNSKNLHAVKNINFYRNITALGETESVVLSYGSLEHVKDAKVTQGETTKIEASGYYTAEFSGFGSLNDSNVMIYAAVPESTGSHISAVHCNGVDALIDADYVQFPIVGSSEEDKNKVITIEAYTDLAEYEKFQLLYDGTVLSESESGAFSIKAGDIPGEHTLKVRVIDKDGTKYSKIDTNVKAYNVTTMSNFSDNKFSITFPDELKIIGGASFSFDLSNLPFFVIKDADSVKIGIGVNQESKYSKLVGKTVSTSSYSGTHTTSGEKSDVTSLWEDWKKTVDDVKKTVTTNAAGVIMEEKIQSFNGFNLGGNIWSTGATPKVDANFAVYAEFKFSEGQWSSIGTNGFFTVSASISNEWQAVVFYVPIVFKLSGSIGADADVAVDFDFSNSKWTYDIDADITIPEIRGSAGIGIAHVFDGSGYVKLTNKINVSLGNAVTGKLSGDLGLSGKFVVFSGEKSLWQFADWEYMNIPLGSNIQKYNSGGVVRTRNMSALSLLSEDIDETANNAYDSKTYALDSRVYLTSQSEWYGKIGNISLFNSTQEDSSLKLLQESIYEAANPKIITTNDGVTMMVWTADIPERSNGNQTAIVYSLYNKVDSTWSEPVIICDDGTADAFADVTTDGEDIYVTWINANKKFDETVTIEEFATSCEVCLSKFDTGISKFEEIVTVTDNESYNFMPVICASTDDVCIAYAENGNADPLMQTGSNAIVFAKIIDNSVQIIKEINVNAPIHSMDVGFINSTPTVAYTADADSNIQTCEDVEIYIFDENTDAYKFTENTKYEQNIQFSTINSQEALSYYSNDVIYYTADFETVESIIGGNEVFISANYCFVNDNEGTVLLTALPSMNNDATSVFASVYNGVGWSGTSQITETEDNVKSFNGCKSPDGNINIIFTTASYEAEILENNGDGSSTGSFNEYVNMYSYEFERYVDISIESVSYVDSNIMPGEQLPVTLKVKNKGTQVIDSVDVKNTFGDIENSTFFNVEILPGCIADIEYLMEVPTDLSELTDVTFEVFAENDIDSSNNTYETKMGYADLSLHIDRQISGGKTSATFVVTNNSPIETNMSIIVRKDTYESESVFEYEAIKIAPYSTQCMYLASDIVNESFSYGDTVCVEVISSAEEKSLGDNKQYFIVATPETEEYTYTILEDNRISITSYNGTDTVVEIPEKYDDYVITSISNNAFGESIEEIIIPSTVNSIAVSAFEKSTSLRKITVDKSNLAYLSSSDGILYSYDMTELVRCPMDYESPTVQLPEALEKINTNAFRNCRAIQEINLTGNITDIGDYAFYGTGLSEITIPKTTKNIGTRAFYSCANLTTVNYNAEYSTYKSDNVLSLILSNYNCFGKNVTKLTIGDTVKTIPNYIFARLNFAEVVISSTVESIGSYAFYGCKNLTSMKLANGSNLLSIGESAFSGCSQLKSIELSDKLNTIGASAFSSCSSLASVMLPETLTTLSNNVFYNCSALEKVVIPHQIVTIGETPFSGCSKLVIWCYKNSAVYNYAINNSISYQLIELDADDLVVTGVKQTLFKDGSYQFSASISPEFTDETIVWESSDENIISVLDSGLVTANNIGEATLTVKSSRGSVSKSYDIKVIGLNEDVENTYIINNANDMVMLATMVNSGISFADRIIKLNNDVDLTGINWIPIGNASTPFSGVFDGKNHTISGFNYETTSSTYSGLFGYIKTGGVKDLTVEGSVNGISRVGMIAGYMLDSALYNCKAIGEVKRIGSGSYGYVGGLVGSALHSVIINCAAETAITVDFGTSSISYATIGGLVGVASVANSEPQCILNSYCIGDITVSGNTLSSSLGTPHYYVGGIAGYLKDDAVNNYYYGEIIDTDTDSIKEIGYAFGYVAPEFTSEGDYNGIGSIIVSDNYYPEGKTPIASRTSSDYDTTSWTIAVNEENFSKLIGEGSLVDMLNGNKTDVEDIIVAHRDILSNSTWAELVDRINGDSFTVSNWKIGSNNLPVNYECDCYRHAESDWVVDVEATCTKEGSKYTYCLVCQETVNTSIIEKAEHKFSDWTETKAATCTEKGSESRTCTACNSATETRDIAKLGHNFDGEWTTDKAATCAEKGSESRTCTRCKSEKETRTVDALGHDFESEWTIDVEATCSKSGSKSHHCSRCDEKDDVTVINKIAHSYKESVQEATCTKDGKKTYNCSSCGDSYSEVITAQGHIDQNGNEKCDNCDYIYDNTCDHMCHKSGFMGFIWKIVRFFWKLFKMNPVCECGVAHY